MLHASLNDPKTYAPFLTHPTWNKALEWLRAMPTHIPLGRHDILGDDMFVSVQEYATLPPEQCEFESHRKYIDIQYTIEGAEAIDWCPQSSLRAKGEFDVPKDLQSWLTPAGAVTRLANHYGQFAIFLSADAHRPKVKCPGHDRVRKLVIKVSTNLFT